MFRSDVDPEASDHLPTLGGWSDPSSTSRSTSRSQSQAAAHAVLIAVCAVSLWGGPTASRTQVGGRSLTTGRLFQDRGGRRESALAYLAAFPYQANLLKDFLFVMAIGMASRRLAPSSANFDARRRRYHRHSPPRALGYPQAALEPIERSNATGSIR
jgi:hypothetical protein